MPATLVEVISHAAADVGSIPTVSIGTSRNRSVERFLAFQATGAPLLCMEGVALTVTHCPACRVVSDGRDSFSSCAGM